jgi:hypothetical protein
VGEADFIQRVILPILYPAGLTPGMQLLLGCVVLAINVPVYVLLVWRRGWSFTGRGWASDSKADAH